MSKQEKTIKQVKNKPTMLVILDGFGLTNFDNKGNAVTPKTAPNIFKYIKKYPSTTLIAHGKDVGLFPNQEGNSEAGHFNIGAGRVVEQDMVRISTAIDDGTFFKNEAFEQALFHVKKYNTAVHVMGLLTDEQSAHAHPEHLYALLDYFRRNDQKKVYLHLFTDGRDSPPHSSVAHLRELRKRMKNGEKIATVIGRFYAMDRNKLWDRTEMAYNAIVLGKGSCGQTCDVLDEKTVTRHAGEADSAEEAISQAYNRGETDEYISPTVIMDNGDPVATIKNNDAIFFFNCRSDRARQITKAMVQKDFNQQNFGSFKRASVPEHTRFVAMGDFGPDLSGIFTAFPSPDVPNCLAKVIDGAYNQLYISETEKYAHVTYFMNGGFADPINGEDRELVKTPEIYSYADAPKMHAKEMTNKILDYFKNNKYDFICVNYPNSDMVGHTGNLKATKLAVAEVDAEVKRLVDYLIKHNGRAMIIADHGNAELMIDLKTGEMVTQHTTNPVPCIIIDRDLKNKKLKKGRLADVAPTLLKLMGISKPKEMTGKALF